MANLQEELGILGFRCCPVWDSGVALEGHCPGKSGHKRQRQVPDFQWHTADWESWQSERGICGSYCFAVPWSHRGPSLAAITRSPGLVCGRDTPGQLVGSILPFKEAASCGPCDIPTRRITLELNLTFQQ